MTEASIEELIYALKHDHFEKREQAAFILGNHRNQQAIEALLEVVRERENSSLCSTAIESLAQLGAREVVPELRKALQTGDNMMRDSAAYALGKLRAREASDDLENALDDKDKKVVTSAAHALAKMNDHRAVQPLIHILETGNTRSQIGSVRVLGELGNEQAVQPLSDLFTQTYDPDLHYAITRALKDIHTEKAAEALVSFIGVIDDKYNKLSIIRILAEMGKSNVVHQLGDIAEKETDEEIRAQAKEVIEKLS